MRIILKNWILIASLLVWLVGCTLPVSLDLGIIEDAPVSATPPESAPQPEPALPDPATVPAESATSTAELALPSAGADLPVEPSAAISTTLASAPSVPRPVFAPQSGTPVATANFVQPQAACAWMGVAGQVFYPDGVPATTLVVEVTGSLAGKPVLQLALTGNSPVLGPGGFELQLASSPQASQGTLTVQIFDLLGTALSDKIAFDTYSGADACSRNLILINFSALRSDAVYEHILPLLYQSAPSR
jgi:hypothetical protein